MVDKTYRGLAAIYGYATCYILAVVPRFHLLQCVAVDNREILHLKSVYGIDIGYHLVVSLLERMCSAIFLASLKCAVYLGSNSTLVSSKQGIARTLCQAVGLAYAVALYNL